MKTRVKTAACTWLGVAFLAAGSATLIAESQKGEVDFGAFKPSSTGEFVEVNIKANLIGMVAKLAAAQEPQVADLLKGLKQIRVNVIGMADDNRADTLQQVKKIQAELTGNGWERIVTAQQQKQDVGVYVKLRGEDAVEGLVVLVLDGEREAVLVNIVGNIKPEQVALVGDRFNIEPLKKAAESLKKT